MKNTEMLLAMNLIDDKFIEEAAPRKRNIRFRRAIIAVAAILVSLMAFLFVPYNTRPPSVREYSDSEYYTLIEKINEYTFVKPTYANNFDMILSSIILANKEEPKGDMTDGMGDSESVTFDDSSEYSEDNEPSGIIEGDIIASNGKYIFRSGNIYLMDGENSKKIYYYDFSSRFGGHPKYSVSGFEMYMSSDGKTLIGLFSTGVTVYRDPDAGDYRRLGTESYTEIVALDVTDPKNIREKGSVVVSGKLLKSAYTDGRLIVASSFEQTVYPIDFSDPSTFVPMIATEWDFSPLPATSIISPAKLSSSRYTVLLMLGEDDLNVIDCKAYLSESSDIYVAENSIYMTRTLTAEEKHGDYTHISPYTVITRISYAENSFKRIGAITLNGRVNSHNFLSQQGEILYAVTETVTAARHDKLNIYSCCECMHRIDIISSNAAIYLIDANKMELVDANTELCDRDLRLASVAYSGGYATLSFNDSKGKSAERVSVRLDNFKKSSVDTESARPSVLLDLGGGRFVTVYVESERILTETRTDGKVVTNVYKTVITGTYVKVYQQTADSLTEIASYLIEKANFSTVYNNEDFVFIDRKLGLIGFGVKRDQYEGEEPDDYDADGYPEFSEERYVLLQFKDSSLSLLADFAHSGNCESARAILSDGWLYVTSEKTLTAKAVNVAQSANDDLAERE